VRRVVVVDYVSLDGTVQAAGNAGEGGFEHGGWTGPFMDDHRRYLCEALPAACAFLLGRRIYGIFAAPERTHPQRTGTHRVSKYVKR